MSPGMIVLKRCSVCAMSANTCASSCETKHEVRVNRTGKKKHATFSGLTSSPKISTQCACSLPISEYRMRSMISLQPAAGNEDKPRHGTGSKRAWAIMAGNGKANRRKAQCQTA